METFPNEICELIATHLDFSTVNAFSLTCHQFAELIKKLAGSIADKNADDADEREYGSMGDDYDGLYAYRRILPNGILHGDVLFRENGKTSFRVTYSLGKPTYWFALEDKRYFWGHMSTQYYVTKYKDSDFLDSATVQFHASKRNLSVICHKHGEQQAYGVTQPHTNENRFAPHIPPPKRFVVDDNICLKHTKRWGNDIVYHILKLFPGRIIHPANLGLYGDRLGFVDTILCNCPELCVLESPIYHSEYEIYRGPVNKKRRLPESGDSQ